MSAWYPTDYPKFRAAILAEIEDDPTGVYEVWWEANIRYGERLLSERLAVAEQLVAELVDQRKITLWRGLDEETRKPIRGGEVGGVLRDWKTWVVTSDAEMVCMDPS